MFETQSGGPGRTRRAMPGKEKSVAMRGGNLLQRVPGKTPRQHAGNEILD
jgi:hypothetical protein